MKNDNIVLVSQNFKGSAFIGGNRAHRNVINYFLNKNNAKVLVIDFSDVKSRGSEKLKFIKISKTLDLLRKIFLFRSEVSKCDLVVCDGILSMFTVLTINFLSLKDYKFITINHNDESSLKRNFISSTFYKFIQNVAVKKSKLNIFFSKIDLDKLSKNKNDIVCLPISKNEAWIDKTTNRLELEISKKYIAIPSNLGYQDNIKGLIEFYEKYRKYFGDYEIVISSPHPLENNASLRSMISNHSDSIKFFETDDLYRSFLANSIAIVIPVFSGSGIQLKAIDALLSRKPVVASDFIRKSHPSFSKFLQMETIQHDGLIDYVNNYSRINHEQKENLIYLESALDIAINKKYN